MPLPKKIFNMPVKARGEVSFEGYPLFFSSAYRFKKILIGNVECIVAEPKAEVRPMQVSKVLARIEEGEGIPCVFFSPTLSAYQRRSLSERGVLWIADDSSFHIPFLGASCRSMKQSGSLLKRLSAGAQAVAVRIVDGSWNAMTTTQIAGEMSKSLSSVSAYFAEIAAIAPDAIGSRGRTRYVASPVGSNERETLLSKLEPFLVTPVKRRIFVVLGNGAKRAFGRLPVSGITALSHITMLADDSWETRAIASSEKDAIAKILENSEVVTKEDSPDALLEVWEYGPTEDDLVSLYLDVKAMAESEDDERLSDAVEELRRRILG